MKLDPSSYPFSFQEGENVGTLKTGLSKRLGTLTKGLLKRIGTLKKALLKSIGTVEDGSMSKEGIVSVSQRKVLLHMNNHRMGVHRS